MRIKPEDACAGLLVVEHERLRDGGGRAQEGGRERERRGDGAKWEDKGDGTRVEVLLCFRLGGVLCGIEDGRLKMERASV
jgi:hypothetical protein